MSVKWNKYALNSTHNTCSTPTLIHECVFDSTPTLNVTEGLCSVSENLSLSATSVLAEGGFVPFFEI